jgi:transcriptional regulator with XRE-family HTH domain
MGTEKQKIIIGKVIREKRQEKKMTQAKVSEYTGLSRNYLSDIENSRYMPSVNSLVKIVKCLDLDLNLLLSATEIQVANN